MSDFAYLTDANFMMYALECYENPHCLDIDEFHDDLKRTKYIKRLLNRYNTSGELKERLVLNHMMVLYNMFGVEAATRILFFKIDEKFWPQLKSFLIYLNFMPDTVYGIRDKHIVSDNIQIDSEILKCLRNI